MSHFLLSQGDGSVTALSGEGSCQIFQRENPAIGIRVSCKNKRRVPPLLGQVCSPGQGPAIGVTVNNVGISSESLQECLGMREEAKPVGYSWNLKTGKRAGIGFSRLC